MNRNQLKELTCQLNAFEWFVFPSLNSSSGWIGTACCLSVWFGLVVVSATEGTGSVGLAPYEQRKTVKKLNSPGTIISYLRPTAKNQYQLIVLAFADASKAPE